MEVFWNKIGYYWEEYSLIQFMVCGAVGCWFFKQKKKNNRHKMNNKSKNTAANLSDDFMLYMLQNQYTKYQKKTNKQQILEKPECYISSPAKKSLPPDYQVYGVYHSDKAKKMKSVKEENDATKMKDENKNNESAETINEAVFDLHDPTVLTTKSNFDDLHDPTVLTRQKKPENELEKLDMLLQTFLMDDND